MDLVLEAKQKRLRKINSKNDLHGWYLHDQFFTVKKIYKNCITNQSFEVSCVTTEYINPFPTHPHVSYVGIVHEYKGDIQHPQLISYLSTQLVY